MNGGYVTENIAQSDLKEDIFCQRNDIFISKYLMTMTVAWLLNTDLTYICGDCNWNEKNPVKTDFFVGDIEKVQII